MDDPIFAAAAAGGGGGDEGGSTFIFQCCGSFLHKVSVNEALVLRQNHMHFVWNKDNAKWERQFHFYKDYCEVNQNCKISLADV